MIYVSTGGRRDVAADVTAKEYLANDISAVELSGGASRPDLCDALKELKRTAPQASSLHEVLRVPVQRGRGGVLEACDVGVEVSAGNDDELLGLTRPAEGFDRQIGRTHVAEALSYRRQPPRA